MVKNWSLYGHHLQFFMGDDPFEVLKAAKKFAKKQDSIGRLEKIELEYRFDDRGEVYWFANVEHT